MSMSNNSKILAASYAAMGALHFIKPEPFDGLIPPGLPGKPRDYTLWSGVAELATAGLLAVPKTRALGGLAATILPVAVWPGNIYMAWKWRDKSWPWQVISIGRLPLQIPIIRSGWRVWKENKSS